MPNGSSKDMKISSRISLEAAAITLRQDDRTVTTGKTNMLGYFQLERLSSGNYTLEILIESDRIIIKDLSV